MKEGRVGIIIVPDTIISNYPVFVHMLMRDMLVLRAERRFDAQGMEYVCIHESFPSKADHSIAPRYHCGFIMGKMEATEEERQEFEVDEFGPVYVEIKKM